MASSLEQFAWAEAKALGLPVSSDGSEQAAVGEFARALAARSPLFPVSARACYAVAFASPWRRAVYLPADLPASPPSGAGLAFRFLHHVAFVGLFFGGGGISPRPDANVRNPTPTWPVSPPPPPPPHLLVPCFLHERYPTERRPAPG